MAQRDENILESELLRWGIVHRNSEFYIRSDVFWEWYGMMLDNLKNNAAFANVSDPLHCYLQINDYFRPLVKRDEES
ncbi:hypothetical protein HYT55_05210 [Candidatus Woesearchaeota archaeon]|nr:hypothetical protein [Candidatus Woesearchaeota archaeon]